MDRLIPDVAGNGVVHADLVIEAIVENAEVKRKVFAQIEPSMKDTAILASNTSSIPLQELTAVLKRPGHLVGIHFFNPVAQMQLVEIVEGPQTSHRGMLAARRSRARSTSCRCRASPRPGFLVNRVLSPYLAEAMRWWTRACRRRRSTPRCGLRHADGTDRARRHGRPRHRLRGGEGARGRRREPPKNCRSCSRRATSARRPGRGFYAWENGKAQKGRADPAGRRSGFEIIAPLPHGSAGGGRRGHRRRCRSRRRGPDLRDRLRAVPGRTAALSAEPRPTASRRRERPGTRSCVACRA